MNVVSDVFKELFSMFMGDARLTLAVLILVAFIAACLKVAPDANPLLTGFALLGGCLTIVIVITSLTAIAHWKKQK